MLFERRHYFIMKSVNSNFANVSNNYLFPTINLKVLEYKALHETSDIIYLGEANCSRPLCHAAIEASKKALDELGSSTGMRGYVPAEGFEFLRKSVCRHYAKRGISLAPDEVFIGNGIKDDISNILDLFGSGKTVVIPDPVYPVYLDTSIMAGNKIVFANPEGVDFLPMPDYNISPDIIYICSPNNPIGTAFDPEPLAAWVAYALDNNAIILFDAAFEAFIRNDKLTHSIYEIEAAKRCAIEFCTLSKSSGFEGMRCGYTIVPSTLKLNGVELNLLWRRRQETKFGGVSYIVQRAAEAVLSDEGQAQIKKNIDYYIENAQIIRHSLKNLGVWCCGGKNSPFIWMKCPGGMNSWDFFEFLLEKAEIVGVPGSGFGQNGEGYFRLSAFAEKDLIIKAMARFKDFMEQYF